MKDLLAFIAVILSIIAFVPAIFFFVRAGYHFFQMLGHYRSGRHQLTANLLPLVAALIPQLFTEQGNVHRRNFLSNLNWALCCFAFIAAVYAFLGI
ncbi:MAG: hypothetical protein JWR60_4322 [Polaromonas sp.]|nr:hypothetical protein [Polaromonas sp.]